MRKGMIQLALGAAMGCTAIAALAAGTPTIEITSPTNNANIQPTPGLGNAVLIKFKLHDFKVVKEPDSLAPQSAAAASEEGGEGMAMSGASQQGTGLGANPDVVGNPQNSGANSPMATGADSETMQSHSNAPAANPHEGQIAVLVDDAHWYFVHSSNDPLELVGFSAGQHRVVMQLTTSDHHLVGQPQSVTFNVPQSSAPKK